MVRIEQKNGAAAALALFVAAAAWPGAYGMLAAAAMSPLQRALAASWCGAPTHAALLGHCAPCWVGAALFAAAGALVLALTARRAVVAA